MRCFIEWELERPALEDEPDEWIYPQLLVEYEYTFGAPETPPAYSHGGLPADPDEVEIISVTYKDKPFILTDGEADSLYTFLVENPPEGDY